MKPPKVVVVSIAVLGACCGAQAASGSAEKLTQPCSQVTDLYAATGTQLEACGFTYAPLASATDMPGGGTSYNYALPDGQTYSIIKPPAGFKPSTASATEDRSYGIPAAPSPQSPAHAAWQEFADGTSAPVTAPPALVVGAPPGAAAPSPTNGPSSALGAVYPMPSSTWAGYTEGTGGGWTETWVSYYEPSLGVTHCPNPDVSFWAGIGDQSTELGQAGTESGEGGGEIHQLFFENLPSGPAIPGVTVSAGEQIISDVLYDGNDNWSYDMGAGGTNHYYAGTGGYNGYVTEAIVERTGVPLLNFNPITMTSLVGRGLSPMNPSIMWNMTGFANTGAMSDGTFTVTHDSCSG